MTVRLNVGDVPDRVSTAETQNVPPEPGTRRIAQEPLLALSNRSIVLRPGMTTTIEITAYGGNVGKEFELMGCQTLREFAGKGYVELEFAPSKIRGGETTPIQMRVKCPSSFKSSITAAVAIAAIDPTMKPPVIKDIRLNETIGVLYVCTTELDRVALNTGRARFDLSLLG
jgi:hypothetical protein